MSPRFVFGWENVPCVAEVVNRSLKADCTDFNPTNYIWLEREFIGESESLKILGKYFDFAIL